MKILILLLTDAPAFIVAGLFLILYALRGKRNDKRWDCLLIASLLTAPASMASVAIVRRLSLLVPLKYDQYVMGFDAHFGYPSFLIGQFISHYFWMKVFLAFSYALLPGAFLILYAASFRYGSVDDAQHLARAFFLLFLLTPLLYLMFPVCGPLYAFPSFPFNVPVHLIPHPVPLSAPPNAVPSGHAATAMLFLYFARRSRVGTVLASIFLALTLLATLGSGEHYLFDLFAAVPYAMAVTWLTGTRPMNAAKERSATPWLTDAIPATAGDASQT